MYNIYSTFLVICCLLILTGCDHKHEVIDSKLFIAKESRLPKWIDLPENIDKSEITIIMKIFASWSGMKVRVEVQGPSPDFTLIMDKVGTIVVHPITEQRGYDKYPIYSIISIDGVDEIIEQKKPGNIVYITDNPK